MALDPDGYLELPAILIGLKSQDAERVAAQANDAPWLAAFVHQCGGHACIQQGLVGLILPLAWSSGAVASEVLRGFDALHADSPDAARRKDLPAELHALHLTGGAPYSLGQLRTLERFWTGAFRLPGAVEGVEALIELAPGDPAVTFGGWKVLTANARREFIWIEGKRDWNEELTAARERWDGATRLEKALIEDLERLLGNLGIEQSLQVFLIWANSD